MPFLRELRGEHFSHGSCTFAPIYGGTIFLSLLGGMARSVAWPCWALREVAVTEVVSFSKTRSEHNSLKCYKNEKMAVFQRFHLSIMTRVEDKHGQIFSIFENFLSFCGKSLQDK
jgi:hypothetical protein